MIILGKDKVDENYNIDDNGVITDLNGNVQETKLSQGRPCFKGVPIHRILMYTRYGWRYGNEWVIHHKDENKLNNSLSNLVFLLHSEHNTLHAKGKTFSVETRAKISASMKGQIPWNKGKKLSEETKAKISENHVGMKGKQHSEETKAKMSASMKGKNKGKVLSEEHKHKISASMKGKKRGPYKKKK